MIVEFRAEVLLEILEDFMKTRHFQVFATSNDQKQVLRMHAMCNFSLNYSGGKVYLSDKDFDILDQAGVAE